MTARNLPLLQDRLVRFDRQPVAVVVADTFERATDAASLVRIAYVETSPQLSIERGAGYHPEYAHGEEPSVYERGDVDSAFATRTRENRQRLHHAGRATQPDGAARDRRHVGRRLSSPYTMRRKASSERGRSLAEAFGIATRLTSAWFARSSAVVLVARGRRGRTRCSRPWPLARFGRPVKLVLARPQMFGSVGYRPQTRQRVALGRDARRDDCAFDPARGPFADVRRSTSSWSRVRSSRRCFTTSRTFARSTRSCRSTSATPTFMRAPGESSGSFALESAMDELAYAVDLDPLELRLRNYAEARSGVSCLPFSSKSLRECYRLGAERFGWSRRTARPRSTTARRICSWVSAWRPRRIRPIEVPHPHWSAYRGRRKRARVRRHARFRDGCLHGLHASRGGGCWAIPVGSDPFRARRYEFSEGSRSREDRRRRRALGMRFVKAAARSARSTASSRSRSPTRVRRCTAPRIRSRSMRRTAGAYRSRYARRYG